MRKLMSVFVVAAFVAAAAAPAAMAAAKVHRISGKVTQVDATKKEVEVNAELKGGKWKKVTFSLTDASKIMAGKKEQQLSDLKAGDHVTVAYTVNGKVHEAQEITVHPATASSHGKKKMKKS